MSDKKKQVEFWLGRPELEGETKPLADAVLSDFGRTVIDCGPEGLEVDARLVEMLHHRDILERFDSEGQFPHLVGVTEWGGPDQDDLPLHLFVFRRWLKTDELGPTGASKTRICLFGLTVNLNRQAVFQSVQRWVEERVAAIPDALEKELRIQQVFADNEADDLSVARQRVQALKDAGLDPESVERRRQELLEQHDLL